MWSKSLVSQAYGRAIWLAEFPVDLDRKEEPKVFEKGWGWKGRWLHGGITCCASGPEFRPPAPTERWGTTSSRSREKVVSKLRWIEREEDTDTDHQAPLA